MRALLLIADVTGYTSYVKNHAVASHHAALITSRILEALIESFPPPFRVADIEGDALFFYAELNEDSPAFPDLVKRQMLRCFARFAQELETLETQRICSCAACRHVGQLKLKQVAHVGDITIGKVHRIKKLYGLDVIVVHRMLKNSVHKVDYAMMTSSALEYMGDFYGLTPEQRREDLEGVGIWDLFVYYVSSLKARESLEADPHPSPRPWRRVMWWIKMHPMTLLELMRIRLSPGRNAMDVPTA